MRSLVDRREYVPSGERRRSVDTAVMLSEGGQASILPPAVTVMTKIEEEEEEVSV